MLIKDKKYLNQNLFCQELIKYFGKNILAIDIFNREIVIKVNKKIFYNLIYVLKNHYFFQYKTLIDLTCVDYPTNKNRFEVSYNLLSYKYNTRLRIILNTNEFLPLESVSYLYEGAVWLEREVWDLFGVLFLKNKDLRRILTDYGFEGFPLRKDYPLSGFLELRYDEEKKSVVYESLEVSQEFRFFKFMSPWEQLNNLKNYKKIK